MLPPVLEIYVVWHPGDSDGARIAQEMVEHFHGSTYSGLIGGAIEVYVRSAGWRNSGDTPRPIPFPEAKIINEVRHAQYVVVVPVLGNELADAVQTTGNPWRDYVQAAVNAQQRFPNHVGVFPYLVDNGAIDGTVLGQVLAKYQRIAAGGNTGNIEPLSSLRCRDLAQGIAQLLSGPNTRLTIFISHTKRASFGEGNEVEKLISILRDVIHDTRLREFFDASDLQPGQDWDAALRSNAASSALLCLRTDLYPSREWCQREILIAKRCGMPMVILDALGAGEERGSFLMDHVPRMPVRGDSETEIKARVTNGLNLLVDECLKRALWKRQEELALENAALDIAWWAPHAPELVTLLGWFEKATEIGHHTLTDASEIRILHPDPPLGPDEKRVLQELPKLMGLGTKLDIMTPRLLAARGG